MTALFRDRFVWQELLGLLGAIVVIVLVALPSFSEPPGRDQGIYLYAGREVLAGKIPHRDIFDQRPPGTVAVYTLGMALFGESMHSVRIIDLVWCLLTTSVIYLIGRRTFGRLAGFWSALIFGVSYELLFNWWDSAACDGLMILPLSLAAYFAIRAEERQQGRSYLWAGVFCAAAFWFKPSAAWIALMLGLVAVTRRPWWEGFKRGFWICAGFLLLNLVLLGWFWLAGGLFDLFSQVVLFNWRVYIRPQFDLEFMKAWAHWTWRFLLKVHLPLILAGLAVFWDARRRRMDRRMVILILWLFGSFVMVWMQWKLFGYHWTPIIAPLALLGGYGASLLWNWLGYGEESRRLWAGRAIALVIVILSLGVYTWRYLPEYASWWRYRQGTMSESEYMARFVRKDYDYGVLQEVATAIADDSLPSDTVLMWGVESIVLFLADRSAPSRFSFTFPVIGLNGGQSVFKTWKDEFLADVQTHSPAFIVLGEHDWNPLLVHSSVEQVAGWPAMQQFVDEHYEWRTTVGGYRLYQRAPM